MRRTRRIILLILVILAAIGIVAYGGLSTVLSRAATRNENKDVELYLFGPIIDGVKKTFLPGLYVHLRSKEGEIYD